MKHLKILALFAILAGIVISCTDNSVDTKPVIYNYFVFNQGSTWKYQDSSYANDSSSITHSDAQGIGQQQYMNRNADVVAERQEEDGSRDTNYYYVDNQSQLYTSLYFVLPSDLSKFGIGSQLFPNQWILIADQNAVSWNIVTLPISNQTFNVPGVGNISLSGDLIIKGAKAGTKTFNIKSNQITAQEFTITVNLKGTATYSFANIPIDANVVTHLYFAENIGFIGYVVDATNIGLNYLGQNFGNIPIYGSSRILTDYTIVTQN